jgi:type IV pilus assembly protein PilA
MQKTLRKMQQKRAGGDSGFTLIELLVVVVIIGVLVAIAIPLYLNYRKGAANKSASSDVRGAVSAVEQFYTENDNAYPATGFTSADGKSLVFGLLTTGDTSTGGSPQTANASPGNQLSYKNGGAGTYIICGMNSDGKVPYRYDSSAGGSVSKYTGTTKTLVGCVAGT